MLKVIIPVFRGKCAKHPRFSPLQGGRGGIKAGCPVCHQLCEVAEAAERYRRIVATARELTAKPREAARTRPAEAEQQEMFQW